MPGTLAQPTRRSCQCCLDRAARGTPEYLLHAAEVRVRPFASYDSVDAKVAAVSLKQIRRIPFPRCPLSPACVCRAPFAPARGLGERTRGVRWFVPHAIGRRGREAARIPLEPAEPTTLFSNTSDDYGGKKEVGYGLAEGRGHDGEIMIPWLAPQRSISLCRLVLCTVSQT